MEAARRFEDLWVWQQARESGEGNLSGFPYGRWCQRLRIRDQIQRAAVSIMNNLAEGFERSTDADFARFLDVAEGSCAEVRSMYYTAEDLGYIASDLAEMRRSKARQISAGIASLAAHLRNYR